MKKVNLVLGCLVIIGLIACADKDQLPVEQSTETSIQLYKSKSSGDKKQQRKLIKDGVLEFETDNSTDTRAKLSKLINEYEGYISSESMIDESSRTGIELIARIPDGNYEQFWEKSIQGIAVFERKERSVNDVTDQFIDINARLKNKKALEERYLLLLNKANTIHSMMEIEEELSKLRGDIESIEGRLRKMNNQVSYATVQLTFFESKPVAHAFGKKFQTGFTNGWNGFIYVLVLMMNLWPFILLFLGVYFGRKFYRKRKS